MSNRICFINNNNKDVSTLHPPNDLILEGGWRYDENRNCIFTLIKTIEVYGDKLYGIQEDSEWLERAEKWANENNLVITSDYELIQK